MHCFWISEDEQYGNGVRALPHTLCVPCDDVIVQYVPPMPGEKWGSWVDHPNPREPDEKGNNAGGFDFATRLSLLGAVPNSWPWWVQWERPLVVDEGQGIVHTSRYRMRPIHRDVLVRALRTFGWGRYANLRNIDLCGAYLYGADLHWSDLWNARLCNADLRYADLSDAFVRGTDLHNADLRYANLCHTDLREANLSNTQMWGVKWNEFTRWPRGFILSSGS